jgi:2-methylisocitrate lyase-like PEP mutase family enzyme
MPVPILANITEFGKTPLFSCEELSTHGVDMVLYPLSAFRAMNQAALKVYNQLLRTAAKTMSSQQCKHEKNFTMFWAITITKRSWIRYFTQRKIKYNKVRGSSNE